MAIDTPCTDREVKKGCVTKTNKKNGKEACFKKGTNEKCSQSGGVPKISNRYKINYLNLKNNYQKGGNGNGSEETSSSDQTSSEQETASEPSDGLKWTNEVSRDTYNFLKDKIGHPNKICKNINGVVEYVVWQDPYEDVKEGRIGGLDFLKITNHHARKWHPKPADVFIIAGKYLEVPDHLLGPIKYASETINVEQLFVEQKGNYKFGDTGKKSKVLVTGSCASINISTVTVAFVEDMIKKHNGNTDVNVALHDKFKAEYDRRINQYIDKGIYNPISWYQPTYFGEPLSKK